MSTWIKIIYTLKPKHSRPNKSFLENLTTMSDTIEFAAEFNNYLEIMQNTSILIFIQSIAVSLKS